MNAFLLLGVLLLAIPLQLLLNHMIKSTETGANLHENALNRIGDMVESLYDDVHSTVKYYSKLNHLKELFVIPHKRKKVKQKKVKESVHTFVDPSTGMRVTATFTESDYGDSDGDGSGDDAVGETSEDPTTAGDTSAAWEVEAWNQKHLYFANSEKIREEHPPDVQFTIGQVVQHKKDHYYGVIIGWDEKCQASREWLRKHGYLQRNRKNLKNSPHYLVLVKDSDSSQSELYYLPQKHLEANHNVQLDYQDLYHYFQNYSEEEQKFVARPWLKQRYPKG